MRTSIIMYILMGAMIILQIGRMFVDFDLDSVAIIILALIIILNQYIIDSKEDLINHYRKVVKMEKK